MTQLSSGGLPPTIKSSKANSAFKIPSRQVKQGSCSSTNEDDHLVQLYVEKKFSLRALSRLFPHSINSIRAHLVKLGVKIRSRSRAMRQKWCEEDYLKKQCHDKGRTKFKIGDRSILDTGYVGIYSPDPAGKRRFPFKKEHRVVAEKYLRRELRSDEQIHHKDGRKTNNDPCNLFLFAAKELHDRYHKNFGRGLFRKLPRRLRIKAKRFLRKYATCIAEFGSKLKHLKHTLIRILGRILQFFIGFESPVRGRDYAIESYADSWGFRIMGLGRF